MISPLLPTPPRPSRRSRHALVLAVASVALVGAVVFFRTGSSSAATPFRIPPSIGIRPRVPGIQRVPTGIPGLNVLHQTRPSVAGCRRDIRVHFNRDSSDAKLLYNSMPRRWEYLDIQIDMEERLRVPVPDGISEEDLRWMWVEITMMNKERDERANEIDPNATGWAKWRAIRPKLRELYQFYQDNFRVERLNCLMEYCDDPELTRERYSENPELIELCDTIQGILDTEPMMSSKVEFSGFPAALDEDAISGALGEFGTVVNIECTPPPEDDEDMGVSGIVEFETPEEGKAAIDRWDGVDMGMGTKLRLKAVAAAEA